MYLHINDLCRKPLAYNKTWAKGFWQPNDEMVQVLFDFGF